MHGYRPSHAQRCLMLTFQKRHLGVPGYWLWYTPIPFPLGPSVRSLGFHIRSHHQTSKVWGDSVTFCRMQGRGTHYAGETPRPPLQRICAQARETGRGHGQDMPGLAIWLRLAHINRGLHIQLLERAPPCQSRDSSIGKQAFEPSNGCQMAVYQFKHACGIYW